MMWLSRWLRKLSAACDGSKMVQYAAVFIGGACGTVLRSNFDYSVMVYIMGPNMAACFLMGASSCALRHSKLPLLYSKAVNAGVLGGLSTYAAPVLVLLPGHQLTLISFTVLISELLLYLLISAAGYLAAAALFRLAAARKKRK